MLPVLAIEKGVILKVVVRVPDKIVEQQPTRHLESLLRRTLGNCINKLGDDLNIADFGMRIGVISNRGEVRALGRNPLGATAEDRPRQVECDRSA